MLLLRRICTLVCFLIPAVASATTLENPQPGSFQSGIGVISGWACEAQLIEVSFDGGPRLRAGTGTIREDTQGTCGDEDNGFGLLYNWNRLGDGVHTVTAYADGVEFASVTVTVTTLGEEVRRGLSRAVTIPDFPDMGTDVVVEWQESQQNFVITAGSPQDGGTSGAPPNVLENPQPGSFQSGIGVISGWACEAQLIEVSFDGGPRLRAGTGTIREDTQGTCGDEDNGFGLLYNWNRLGDGVHTVTAYADGVEFASVTVTVTTLGEEVRRGLSRAVTIPDFPDMGTDVVVEWQESQQNFVLSSAASTTRTVTVQPTLSLPTGVSIPNVEVTSLHSDTTVAVQASPEPSLLLATDADGTVLLSVADMDGGFLGEGQGEVDVSINSTAVTLVALAAGYRISDIDQGIVDQITAHTQYPALLTALTQGLQADKNFLDRIMEHTETVRLIRQVAGFRTESAQQMRVKWSAASEPVLPNGVMWTNFWSYSPWKKGEPWRWFGETAKIAPTPPFLAVSAQGRHAAGNPNFVDYALEFYSDGSLQDWYYIPGNGSLIDKGRNSGAALSGLPDPRDYTGPPVDQVRFARYRLSGDSSRALALSFLNTAKLLTTTAGLIVSTGALESWFKKLNVKDTTKTLAACGTALADAVTLPTGTAASKATLAHWFIANIGSGVQAVANCVKKPELAQAVRGDPLGLAKTLAGWGVEISKGVGKWANPLGWAWIGFEVGNELLPTMASYVAPAADSIDYYVNWYVDQWPALVRADVYPLPAAPTGIRLEVQHFRTSSRSRIRITWDDVPGQGVVYNWSEERPRQRVVWRSSRIGRTEAFEEARPGVTCYTVVQKNDRGMESLHSELTCTEPLYASYIMGSRRELSPGLWARCNSMGVGFGLTFDVAEAYAHHYCSEGLKGKDPGCVCGGSAGSSLLSGREAGSSWVGRLCVAVAFEIDQEFVDHHWATAEVDDVASAKQAAARSCAGYGGRRKCTAPVVVCPSP